MDLVPATTPKGLVAFFNIFPALIVGLEQDRQAELMTKDESRMASDLKRKNPICSPSRILHICQLARDCRTCLAFAQYCLQLIS